MLDRMALESALAGFDDPVMGEALAGCVEDFGFDEAAAWLRLSLPFPAARYAGQLQAALAEHLAGELDGRSLQVTVDWAVAPQAVQGSLKPMPNIKNIIAVASGKGGVGKSTVSANLALALAAEGAAVGMLDADIYGPSQPRMLGVEGEKPEILESERKMRPIRAHGIAMMSIGLLVDAEQPTIWRGPMVTQALDQLLGETQWPALDYLVIDLPPGTGDTQLSLAQRIPVSGAVIVTTPQDIALLDARKGLKMFQKVGVTVLGIVENMSTHVCSNCGHVDEIFGAGGGQAMAEQYHVPLLGQLPLHRDIRLQADSGGPTVVADPDGELAAAYFTMARRTAFELSQAGEAEFPEIVVE